MQVDFTFGLMNTEGEQDIVTSDTYKPHQYFVLLCISSFKSKRYNSILEKVNLKDIIGGANPYHHDFILSVLSHHACIFTPFDMTHPALQQSMYL